MFLPLVNFWLHLFMYFFYIPTRCCRYILRDFLFLFLFSFLDIQYLYYLCIVYANLGGLIMKELLLTFFVLLGFGAAAQKVIVAHHPDYAKSDTILCYMPSEAASDRKIPTVIALHGYGGGSWQWPSICDLQMLADDYGVMIVCPDGFADSWYMDSPRGGNDYASFFGNAILPAIERELPVDTSLMFITGLSMGGHGALHLALRYRGKFRAAGSMSGVLDLSKSSLVKTSLSKILGPLSADNDNWMRYSAIGHVEAFKESAMPIIISCGAQDYLVGCNREFARKCASLGVDAVYTESPGRHEARYWKAQLPEHIRFFRKFINK